MKKLFLAIIGVCVLVNIGYARWDFSSNKDRINEIGVNIIKFKFNDEWDGYENLDDNTYDYSKGLRDALNGNDERSQALTDAINARKSTDWVGNMDMISNVADNLDKVLDVLDDCKYIIKLHNDDYYELFVTYENLDNKRLYTRFGPVYRTEFKRNANGEFEATQSDVGTATITYYDIKNNQYQKSFNTDEFIV